MLLLEQWVAQANLCSFVHCDLLRDIPSIIPLLGLSAGLAMLWQEGGKNHPLEGSCWPAAPCSVCRHCCILACPVQLKNQKIAKSLCWPKSVSSRRQCRHGPRHAVLHQYSPGVTGICWDVSVWTKLCPALASLPLQGLLHLFNSPVASPFPQMLSGFCITEVYFSIDKKTIYIPFFHCWCMGGGIHTERDLFPSPLPCVCDTILTAFALLDEKTVHLSACALLCFLLFFAI